MLNTIRYSYTIAINILIICAISAVDVYAQQGKLLYEISRQKTNGASAPKFMHIKRLSYYPDTMQWV